MLKRMFRTYAHIYHHHLDVIKASGSEAHLNTCFKHFYFFVDHFQLCDPKDLEPMKSFIDKMNRAQSGGGKLPPAPAK